jgi:5-methyltetrahydrofolate--homocysteine methyltransferase
MREALDTNPKGDKPTLDEITAAMGDFSSASDGTGDGPKPERKRRGRRG